MKKLIVNADDFGQDPHLTKGILECMKKGIVTSSTIITNYSDINETIKKAKAIQKEKNVSFGLHINLCDGTALSGKSSLTDKNNKFHSLGKLLILSELRLIKASHVKKEIELQLNKLTSQGLMPSHFDGHRHVHMNPLILKEIVKVMKKNSIFKIRLPYERILRPVKGQKIFSSIFLTKILVSLSSLRCKGILIKNKIKFNTNFAGMSLIGIQNHQEVFLNYLEALPEEGVTEFLCHPGYASKYIGSICRYNKEREIEMNTLQSAKTLASIKKQNIHLSNYNEALND